MMINIWCISKTTYPHTQRERNENIYSWIGDNTHDAFSKQPIDTHTEMRIYIHRWWGETHDEFSKTPTHIQIYTNTHTNIHTNIQNTHTN